MTHFDMDHSCPSCSIAMDAVSSFEGTGCPDPGDITICIRCAAVGVFTEDMGVRLPSADEKAVYMADPNVQRAVSAVLEVNQRRGRP